MITVVGFLETRTVPSSAKFRSLLLSMCIGAPETTTHSLSLDSVEDGAGNDQTSEGEWNVA